MAGSLLSLRGVWLSYRRGRRHVVRVLVDASLEVCRGEVVMVMAQRAQGKTSLLRVAAGLERPDRGSVLVDGRELWRREDRSHLRRARRDRGAPTALIRPTPPEVTVTVLDSIALPLASVRRRRPARIAGEEALERAGVRECAQSRWEDLSDGERARVAIAQGLAREPSMLLADDLTATLDLGEAEEIAQLLHELAAERGLGVLMGVGDTRTMHWSTRVATLAGGVLMREPGASGAEDARRGPGSNVVELRRG